MAFTQSKIEAAQDAASKAANAPPPQTALVSTADDYFGFAVSANEVMLVLLAIFVIFLAYHGWKAQRARAEFNLIDLILGDDGKISPERFIVMVAFSLHSWTILKWIITGIVSTADFVSYGAIWVTPLIVSIVKKPAAEKAK
jgi:hypothetical protein